MTEEYFPCSHFVKDCHRNSQVIIFSDPCNKWDNHNILKKHAKHTHSKYKCLTKHTCSDAPTQLNNARIFKARSEWDECTVSSM